MVASGGRLTDGARKILDSASELFYRNGIHAVGVDAIAAGAGVTKRTLYDRFGSKDALVVAYLTERDRRWWERFEERLATAPRPRVLAVFDSYRADVDEGDRGCAFINAAAELPFSHPAYDVIRDHSSVSTNGWCSWSPRTVSRTTRGRSRSISTCCSRVRSPTAGSTDPISACGEPESSPSGSWPDSGAAACLRALAARRAASDWRGRDSGSHGADEVSPMASTAGTENAVTDTSTLVVQLRTLLELTNSEIQLPPTPAARRRGPRPSRPNSRATPTMRGDGPTQSSELCGTSVGYPPWSARWSGGPRPS